jgi:hypothetical protein
MLGRRAFLTRLGIGAAAAPVVARQALEAASGQLAGVTMAPARPPDHPPSGKGGAPQVGTDTPRALKKLWQVPALRDEYESLMFERNQRVGYIDLDLATKRSFSLAAKVAYQRQRNVARDIADDMVTWEEGRWGKTAALLKRAVGFPFT